MKIPIFYKQILLIFLFVNLSGYLGWTFIGHNTLIHYTYWYSNLFFFLIITLSHLIASQGLKYVKDFHMFYFASMAIRFMLALMYVFCFAFLGVEYKITFVLNFMYLYLIYTSFEIYTLIRNLRTDFK